ncbi:MAG: mannose-1-phosphate guanyltransferase, partial [Campylobacterales bacterium]
GIRLSGHKALLATLYLLHKTEEAKRVYLPVWAPDIADYLFDGMIIERGKQIGMKVNDLMQYDFIGTGQGSFIFREFSLISDAIYAGVKIMQMLAQTGMSLSEVLAQIPDFYYLVHEVHCPARLKGKMMRKFREESEGHEASFVDGVKIRFDARTWILMIPDQHADSLHLFVQSDDAQDGEALYRDFIQKIERWIAEDA